MKHSVCQGWHPEVNHDPRWRPRWLPKHVFCYYTNVVIFMLKCSAKLSLSLCTFRFFLVWFITTNLFTVFFS